MKVNFEGTVSLAALPEPLDAAEAVQVVGDILGQPKVALHIDGVREEGAGRLGICA